MAVIGASIGFKLILGPIFSGLLAAIIGFFVVIACTIFFIGRKKTNCLKACLKSLCLFKAQKKLPH
ncbi:hypothetical protein AAHH67_02090 [Niallia circulans]